MRRHPVQVDRDQRQVLVEHRHVEKPGAVDLALADLDDPAELRGYLQIRQHRLARSRTDHDVDPVPAGEPTHLVGRRQRPGVDDVGGSDASQQIRPLLVGRGADHPGPGFGGDLHRGHADAAGAAGHQHPFAGLHPGRVLERVVRRHQRHHRAARIQRQVVAGFDQTHVRVH
jgi:hypothetical protein